MTDRFLGYMLVDRIGSLGAPNFAGAKAFAEWIERVRSLAFLGGARGEQITEAEVAALLPYIQEAILSEADDEREAAARFLRSEANDAGHGQSIATTDRDKLYRMGQKDGLRLAADAIERKHHLAREAASPNPSRPSSEEHT